MDSEEEDDADGVIKGIEGHMLFLPHAAGSRGKVCGVGLRPNCENKKEADKKAAKGKKMQVIISVLSFNLHSF